MKGKALAFAVLIGFFLVWEALVRTLHVKQIILPAPSAIFTEFWHDPLWYLGHGWYTLLVTLGGFALA